MQRFYKGILASAIASPNCLKFQLYTLPASPKCICSPG